MSNIINKTPVFLIDMSRSEDYALFLEELGELKPDAPRKKLSGHSFITEQVLTHKQHRRYLCITIFGQRMFWGGDSELRPLGKFTPEYVPIMGKAITIKHYLEIIDVAKKEDDVPKPQRCSYYVQMDTNVSRILAKDGFEGWHHPYFAMKGHTHNVYNICPFEQVYHDAAPTEAESIAASEFVSMYKKTYEPSEPMDFCDYIDYLDEWKKKGYIVEPELDDSVEELYYKVMDEQPKGIVRIPENTLRILPKTFKSCRCIIDVIFPEGLLSIGKSAFDFCVSLQRIYMPKSIKQIHFAAFHNCFSLVEVYYEGSEKEWKALCDNNISDKSKYEENGIAKFKNDELLKATVHFDCRK